MGISLSLFHKPQYFRKIMDISLSVFHEPQHFCQKFLHACKIGDIETIQKILPSNFLKIIELPSCRNYIKIFELLLQSEYIDPSEDENYALTWACRKNHAAVVRLLLRDKRISPSHLHLIEACQMGCLEVVKLLLLDGRIDPTASVNEARRGGNFDVLKILLKDSRVDPSANDNELIKKICLQSINKGDFSSDGHYISLLNHRTFKEEQLEIAQLLLRDKRVNNSFILKLLLEHMKGLREHTKRKIPTGLPIFLKIEKFLRFEMYKCKLFLCSNICSDYLIEDTFRMIVQNLVESD